MHAILMIDLVYRAFTNRSQACPGAEGASPEKDPDTHEHEQYRSVSVSQI
jgi:hypothetical protein